MIVFKELCGDSFTQLDRAGRRSIFGETFLDGGNCGLFDEIRGIKIWFAGAETDNIAALGFKLVGTGCDGEGCGSDDVLDPAIDFKHVRGEILNE